MSDSFDDGVFDKARRNLMGISAAVIVFALLSPSISKISVLGTEVSVGGDHSRLWAAFFVISLYMLVRFIQVLDVNDVMDNARLVDLKQRLVVKLSMLLRSSDIKGRIVKELAGPDSGLTVSRVRYYYDAEFVYRSSRFDDLKESLKGRSISHYKKTLDFVAEINYSAFVSSPSSVGAPFSTISNYEVRPYPPVIWVCNIVSILISLLVSRWSSDYVFPIFLGALSLSYSFSHGCSVISSFL